MLLTFFLNFLKFSTVKFTVKQRYLIINYFNIERIGVFKVNSSILLLAS